MYGESFILRLKLETPSERAPIMKECPDLTDLHLRASGSRDRRQRGLYAPAPRHGMLGYQEFQDSRLSRITFKGFSSSRDLFR